MTNETQSDKPKLDPNKAVRDPKFRRKMRGAVAAVTPNEEIQDQIVAALEYIDDLEDELRKVAQELAEL
jgi:hypothetical protein